MSRVNRFKATVKLLLSLRRLYRQLRRGHYALTLDYDISFQRRWTTLNPNGPLLELVAENRPQFRERLASFVQYRDSFARIPLRAAAGSAVPTWINRWMPPLDAVSVYSLLVQRNPRMYLEVGSGISTTFARKAIQQHELKTRIVSIDPQPRREIDAICDQVVRQALQDTDLKVFNQLAAGDIILLDGSHRCLMNSDVTAFFLEVLPALPPGVLVGIHDIFLPHDYPEEFAGRFYSEQYVLAAFLLGDVGRRFEIVLPLAYLSAVGDTDDCLRPIWEVLPADLPRHGAMFWLASRRPQNPAPPVQASLVAVGAAC